MINFSEFLDIRIERTNKWQLTLCSRIPFSTMIPHNFTGCQMTVEILSWDIRWWLNHITSWASEIGIYKSKHKHTHTQTQTHIHKQNFKQKYDCTGNSNISYIPIHTSRHQIFIMFISSDSYNECAMMSVTGLKCDENWPKQKTITTYITTKTVRC